MFYTMSLNPVIDRTFYLSEIKDDDVNRISRSMEGAGGKGINVARMLSNLGCACTALAFIGGPGGELLKMLMESDRISYRYVDSRGDVRSAYNFIGGGRVLRFNEAGPRISAEEKERFFRLLGDMDLGKGDIISMSGSLPPGIGEGTYAEIIERVRDRVSLTALDADGAVLRKGVEAYPDIIKPNLWELERLSGRKIREAGTLGRVVEGLLNKGISRILLTLGERGAVSFTRDSILLASVPAGGVSGSVGCGDAFLAGFLCCAGEGSSGSEALHFAAACGSAKAREKGNLMPSRDSVERIYGDVSVAEVDIGDLGDLLGDK